MSEDALDSDPGSRLKCHCHCHNVSVRISASKLIRRKSVTVCVKRKTSSMLWQRQGGLRLLLPFPRLGLSLSLPVRFIRVPHRLAMSLDFVHMWLT